MMMKLDGEYVILIPSVEGKKSKVDEATQDDGSFEVKGGWKLFDTEN